MKAITICMCLFAIIAIGALVLLLYLSGANTTGAVSTGVCPPGSAPILAEGPGKWREEIAAFEARGHQCFWGYDGITPCCGRTEKCCLSFL
jgi:hypothetical protein